MEPVRHINGHFITEPAASETDPVISSVQQLQLEAQAMTSNVQCGLVVGIVFRKLLIRKYKMFCLPKPILMASAVQQQESRLEGISPRNFPIPCAPVMH